MSLLDIPNEYLFPNPSESDKDGLIAIGGSLEPQRIIAAYQQGIFPWYNRKPILWWSPDPRCVLYPHQLKISKSLLQSIRSSKFEVRFDTCFDEVISHCAKVKRKGEKGTWITKEMKKAYIDIHTMGFAHSIEVFHKNQLVGGLYGLSIGKCFFGESMFHLMTDASKVALYYLVQFSIKHHFDLIDTQVTNDHLLSLGAQEIPRDIFLKTIEESIKKESLTGNWSLYLT